jgi:hypothetical protein
LPPKPAGKRSYMSHLIYAVSFQGVASDALRAAFDDCEVETGHGTTTVRCPHDALRGVLNRIQDLGLDLLDVASSDEPTASD